MLKKITLPAIAMVLAGCSSIQPFGKQTVTTETYYYQDGFSAKAVWSCLAASLASDGYYPQNQDYSKNSQINRMFVSHGTERVGILDVYNIDNRVSSMAFVNNKDNKLTFDKVQKQCVSASGYKNHAGISLIEGVIEAISK